MISRIGMFTLTKTMCENVIYCTPVKFKGGGGTIQNVTFNNISNFCSVFKIENMKFDLINVIHTSL